jgi:hypothetical protein
MELIPTHYKTKIPKNLSYPFGAEILSNALKDIKKYDDLSVAFSDYPFRNKSEYKKLIENKKQIPVLDISYRYDKYPFFGEYWDKDFCITIYAVPRDKNKIIRDTILEIGIPIIKEWISKKRPETWYYKRQEITLLFDLEQEKLISKR